MTSRTLTNEEVVTLFDAREVVDAGVPKYAPGGAALDNNNVPGFAVGDSFGRKLQEEPYKTEESVTPMMEGGRRRDRTRTRTRKQKRSRSRSQRQRGGRKPRLQLTLRATVRLRSRSRRLKQRQ